MIRPGKMIKQVLGSLFKKPATTQYPFHKKTLDVPARFRGKLKFYPEKCIGCKIYSPTVVWPEMLRLCPLE